MTRLKMITENFLKCFWIFLLFSSCAVAPVTENTAAVNPKDLQAVRTDMKLLSIQYSPGDTTDDVKSAIILPLSGPNGSRISWKSSRPDYISADGTVNRDDFVKAEVKLTATYRKGGALDDQILILYVTPRKTVNYYVAVNGNDSNNGSLQSPLASLTKALELAASQPGIKNIALSAGVYNLEPYIHFISASGIHIYGGFKAGFADRNYRDRENLLYKTEIRTPGTTTIFQISNCSSFILEGMVIKSESIYDFFSFSNIQNLLMQHNTLIRTGTGNSGEYLRGIIVSQSENVNISDNIINFSQVSCQGSMTGIELYQTKTAAAERNQITFGTFSGTSFSLINGLVVSGGDTISDSVNSIRYNTVDIGTFNGTQKYGNGMSVTGYENGSTSYFSHNRIIIRNNSLSVKLTGFTSYQVSNGFFYNNLIEIGSGTSDEIYGMELSEDSVWKIENNSIAIQAKATWIYGIRAYDNSPLIRNNIIGLYNQTSTVRNGIRPDTSSHPTATNNCVYVNGGESAGGLVLDSTNLTIDPKLSLTNKLKLTAQTPASVKQGALNLYEQNPLTRTDYENQNRPETGNWTIGAYR